jgi:hypothetical protein
MNISTDLIKQYADARQKLMDAGVISSFIHNGEIHVRAITLVDEEGLQIENRSDKDYPYELYVMVEGIKIFGLMSEEQLKQYPQFQGYMIDDVNLTGNDGDDHAA